MYRLIEKLHLERYLNTRLILAIDLAVSGLASLCALVSVKLLLHLNISDYTLLWLCCSVVYSFVTFYLLKTYHSVIRHSTLRELSKFVVATFSKEILLGLTVVLYPPAPQFSLHILALLLLDLLLTLCGLILIRVAMIIIYDLVKDNLKYRKQRQQEENPCEAVLVNVIGTRNVALKCLEYNVEKMVMISTDKAVNPTNIMGCTKRLAEIYVQSLGLAIEQGTIEGATKFVTTRFGNVLGSNGSVIPRFREQIAKGGPVTVTHPDITRFFMTIPEACQLVMEAATISTGNQICVFDMGKSVKIADLAKRMIELAGYEPGEEIKIEYTGLRPGEKLYEEVLSNTENTIPTTHDRIRIAKVREYDYAEACAATEQLEQFARMVNVPDTVCLMKKIVPEFKSKNSEFEQFDKVQPA